MVVALQWTISANRDLIRLHAFLNPINPRAASPIVQQSVAAAEQLLTYPRLGERLMEFAPRACRFNNYGIASLALP